MTELMLISKANTEYNDSLDKSKNNLNKTEINKDVPPEMSGLSNIESRYSREVRKALKKIEKRKPKDLGSIFDQKKIFVKKIKIKGDFSFSQDFFKKDRNTFKEIERYNVFKNEDNIIRELMSQFKEKNTKDKIPKLVRKKMAFNKLYEISNESSERLENIKKSKKFYTLEKYQENMLKAIDVNSIEQSQIMNLIQNLNDIKYESNKVNALPPIKVNVIRDHVIRISKKNTALKKKNFKEIMNSSDNIPMDQFEIEEKMIKDMKGYKSHPKAKRNKNFDKLPKYFRDIFSKKRI
jgi:hypothetical protein